MVNSWQKNMAKNIIIGTIIIIIITIFIVLKQPKNPTFPDNIGLSINNKNYYLEVAQNSAQRAKGLSGREKLCPNCGMLFVFNKEGKHPFWMKNTLIPLDMIWLNSQNKVVKIYTAINTNSLESYINDQPAQYVIELNANEVFKLDLKVGDTIQLPHIDDK